MLKFFNKLVLIFKLIFILLTCSLIIYKYLPLKLFNLKSNYKNKNIIFIKSEGDKKALNKYYPTSTKEWFNSIYTFNKNNIKLLPTIDNIASSFIKGYFNMYNKYLDKKSGIRRKYYFIWKKIITMRKFWISKPELKHSNDTLNINIYIYNRQKKYYFNKIKQFNYRGLFILLKKNFLKNKNEYYKEMEFINKNLLIKLLNKNLLINVFNNNIYYYWIKNSFINKYRKILFFMNLIQSSFLNRFKFKSTYLLPLNNILSKLYNKKITFNIIKLKNFYLNSDILTQILVSKTRNRKNNILRILSRSMINIKVPNFNPSFIERKKKELKDKQNYLIIESIKAWNNKDLLEKILNRNFEVKDRIYILNSFKNKTISGIRFKASGRLTKRITAARAISKVKYVGTIKNIDSSYKGLSSVILRGNIKSNIQHTKLYSNTRLGSFGLKGWVSSV